jgi:dTDP-4-amino-4,6-dideoxygalactose transaminase
MMIKPFDMPITAARPVLPSLEEFRCGLEGIWDRAWLTNNGPLVQQFRDNLIEFCGTKNLSLFVNGTLALQIALQGMGITGDVITTPFTFVATTHALFWNKIRPVFVDIEPEYYSLDPAQVEAAITPWTSAILAVHVYGQPCRLRELEQIARKHGLKLLYDAAHAFGVEVDGTSIAQFGDLSMFSFHATKIFHSIEGGMLTFRDPEYQRLFDYLKNFGFENETEVVMPGTNAKMNEFQALMGLLLLSHLDEMIEKRRIINVRYRERLGLLSGIRLVAPPADNVRYNYAYMPVEVEEDELGMTRDQLYLKLREYNVLARKYFYPLVPDFACYRGLVASENLLVARRVASRILALPIYSDLALNDVDRICDIIEHIQSSAGRGTAADNQSLHADSELAIHVAQS